MSDAKRKEPDSVKWTDVEKEPARMRQVDNDIGMSDFVLIIDDIGTTRKGLLKISRHIVDEANGFIKCMFIIKMDDEEADSHALKDAFAGLDANPGQQQAEDFVYVRPAKRDEDSPGLFIEEVFFHFHTVEGASHEAVKDFIIPFMELRLPIRFREIQWWLLGEEKTLEEKKSLLGRLLDSLGL